MRKQIEIGLSVKVKRAPHAKIVEMTPDKDQETHALFYPDTMTIFLSDHLNEFESKYFFFHEIGHAIMYQNGLSMILPNKIQEVICQSFATAFCRLVK
jgi:Zn-dependent peptidase ImmA (M78 family)